MSRRILSGLEPQPWRSSGLCVLGNWSRSAARVWDYSNATAYRGGCAARRFSSVNIIYYII